MRCARRAKPHAGAASPTPEGRAAALLLLPSLLGTAVFVLLPFAETVRRSFCDARGRFAGFANYRAVLENAAFQLAARNTARFLCSCVPILLAVSLLLALGGAGGGPPAGRRRNRPRPGVPHKLPAANGDPGGKHCGAVAGAVCRKRAGERLAWRTGRAGH